MFHTLKSAVMAVTLLYFELFIPQIVESMSDTGKTVVEKLK